MTDSTEKLKLDHETHNKMDRCINSLGMPTLPREPGGWIPPHGTGPVSIRLSLYQQAAGDSLTGNVPDRLQATTCSLVIDRIEEFAGEASTLSRPQQGSQSHYGWTPQWRQPAQSGPG